MTPWELNPNQLISWWDMEKFTAEEFFSIGRYLATARRNMDSALEQKEYTRDTELGEDIANSSVTKTLNSVEDHCAAIGLTVSIKAAKSLIAKCNKSDCSLGEVLEGITQLENVIAWEMKDKLFMYIPPERATYYDNPKLLGDSVYTKFPTVQFDAAEAGNCYASGRGTAVVFHLMRIMEIGVQEFGKSLGVIFANEKNWQNILDEINKAIKNLPKDPKTKEMAEASSNLYSVKLAWRNEVMHPKDTYTLEEAENIIRQVKIFMEQL